MTSDFEFQTTFAKMNTRYSIKEILGILLMSIAIGFVSMAIFCGGECFRDVEIALISSSYGAVLSFGLWLGNGFLSEWLSQKFPWEQKTITRLVWGVVASVLYSAIYVAIWHYIFFVEILGNSIEWYQRVFVNNIVIALLITGVISLFLHAREFLQGWREAALIAERLQREQVQSKLKSLRDQLNPHFLFNSLNVLTSLVHKNPDEAEQFIKKLSETYRYVLEKTEQETVSLEEELDFIQGYLALLKHRFGNNLVVDWHPPVAKGWSIPPLSLQMLVENAVKHNVISTSKPLTVSVSAGKEGYLTIRNNLQQKRLTGPSSGVGLPNIMARYKHLTDKVVEINSTETHFEVHLPLLHIQPA